MTNGWLFLGIATLICAGVFLNGLRFSRMSDEKISSGRIQMELPGLLARGRSARQQVRLFGLISMIFAPLFLIFFAALCFGLFGPVDGIQTINL